MLRIDPSPLTLGQLIDMHWAYQQNSWDHTVHLLRIHAGKDAKKIRNPYRHREPKGRQLMTPEELYALAAAIENKEA